MKAIIARNVVRLTALAMLAGSMIGIAGPAQAQTREHILLARQIPVPVATVLDIADPTDPQTLKDCWWNNGKLYCIYYVTSNR
jgi:translation elongation factor EF-Tu-like GTPase